MEYTTGMHDISKALDQIAEQPADVAEFTEYVLFNHETHLRGYRTQLAAATDEQTKEQLGQLIKKEERQLAGDAAILTELKGKELRTVAEIEKALISWAVDQFFKDSMGKVETPAGYVGENLQYLLHSYYTQWKNNESIMERVREATQIREAATKEK